MAASAFRIFLVMLGLLATTACLAPSPEPGPDGNGQADGGAILDAGPGGNGAGEDAGAGPPDAGLPPLECFDFSLDPDIPLALDGTFSAESPLWRRPHDDPPICPATALLPESAAQVPFVAYAFCNTDSAPHFFDFQMLAQDGPSGEAPLDDPYLILYDGIGIPADPLQCLAVNDDIPDALEAADSEILGSEVPAGGAITVVGTTYTFDPTDGTGTGYYILVVQNAD
jgi:hypothetical protein